MVLVVLLAGTWGLRAWRTSVVQQQTTRYQKEVVQEALTYAEEQFEQLQHDLLRRAETVARAPVVVRGLGRRGEGERARVGPLVRYTSALEWPERYAVEIYDPLSRMLAWRGFSIPLEDAPGGLRFLEAPQTAIAGSEGVRQALVAWHPVREGGRTIGAVRVSKVVRFRAPVQNEYLQNYSLAAQWSQATGYALAVYYGPERPADVSPEAAIRALQSVRGRTLGHVAVEPPPEAQLVQDLRARFSDWMALWATLLLTLGGAVLWRGFGAALGCAGKAPPPRRLARLTGRFAVAGAVWIGFRYVLLELGVPARWAEEVPALASLFDPARLASTVGAGALRSTGDFLISGVFAFGLGGALLRLGGCFWSRHRSLNVLRKGLRTHGYARPAPVRYLAVIAVTSAGVTALVAGLAGLARRAVLDSTFDFFARTGLLPRPLVLVVFCALLLFAAAVVLGAAGLVSAGRWGAMRYAPQHAQRPAWVGAAGAALVTPLALGYALLGAQNAFAAWPLPLVVGGASAALVRLGLIRPDGHFELLTLRWLLPGVLFLGVVVYPMLYGGMSARRHVRLRDAAAAFSEGGDPRLLFSLEQVLQEARQKPALRAPLLQPVSARPTAFDSLGSVLLRGSLLSSLGAYDVNLTLYDHAGTPVGRYAPGPDPPADQDTELSVLRNMYQTKGGQGTMVTQITGWRTPERFQYAGLAPVYVGAGPNAMPDSTAGAPSRRLAPEPAGWLVVQATPQTVRPEAGTPFPRALLPEGYYADLYAEVALAEFRGGTLVRNLGRDFGRVRLPQTVQQALATTPVLWRTEENEGSPFLTLYRRQDAAGAERAPLGERQAVTAARVPAVTTFDHLYYALRVVIAGFLVAVPLYLAGLGLRYQAALLPAPRVRFRDKVLNALLGVGAIAVVVVGLVGLRVLTGENERTTQQWLRQRLEQVEEILATEAEGSEPLYQVAERIGIDRLAARVGLDLNLYEGARLVASSRPRLVEEHLIDRRLPVEAYESLYYAGERFATTQQTIGRFPYAVGFRALTDAQGQPQFVLSAPTLPEQERIAEEQARTVAYLFGALLLLILLVTVTALVLASALTRPLRRIRAGLEAVGKGEFARALPTDTRDEIGELAATFNEMRDQLAESRRKLAQQEREMAWREMARQVAHEIKNPLTPMKLSVQHLRRAFEREYAMLERPARAEGGGDGQPGEAPADGSSEERRFPTLFERITSTLIEQIDSLSRIANDFSSFARLPTRVTEPLDLNETVEAAASLMQEEQAGAEIHLHLHPEALVVEADPEELRRLYINLIKNALQALPEDAAGQRKGRVEVATTRMAAPAPEAPAAGRARSTVSDNGSGVPEELREKIFQPNFSTKTSGTGLGLAIAKKGIEELGGDIGFETEEGKGTTFWVELPLRENGEEET